jgi:hypothetical protein
MKTKLLRKLRDKYHIVKHNDGTYMVEGSHEATQIMSKDINEVRNWRRKMILREARDFYHEYSVLRKKTFN